MKKNKTLAVAIIALVIGYVAGDVIGVPPIEKNSTSGDISSVEGENPYNVLLVSPENMCFNKELSGDKDAIQRTESTLKILDIQIRQFNSLCEFAHSTVNNDKMSYVSSKLEDAASDNLKAYSACQDAIGYLQQLQEGKDINLKKANAAATRAYKIIATQMAAGKAYVKAIDDLAKENSAAVGTNLASVRDMMANFCSADASLCQNDAEIDYWSNTGELKANVDMARE